MAAPIIVANISVPVMHAVDTAVVGHMPDPHWIGGVAIGTVLFTYVHASFNFLRMGTTGPTAQAAGAARAGIADAASGGWGEVRNTLWRALLVAATIGLIVVALQRAIIDLGLGLIDPSAEVADAADTYLGIRIWSTPAALAIFAMIGWLYGLEDSRGPLAIQLFCNGVNVVLDFLFVFGFGWGIWGVGLATVIAEYAAVALGFVLILRRLRRVPKGEGRTRVLDPARIRRMVAINRDIFIRTFCLISGVAVFMAASARLGDVPLAANQVLFHFLQITAYGLDGFANAAEALVGEAYGRAKRAGVVRAVRAALTASGLVALVFSAFWIAIGGILIDVMTGIPEVRSAARDLMPWAAMMPIVSVWAFMLDGIFLGATRSATIRNAMIAALIGYLAILAVVFPGLGTTGLWLALTALFALRSVTLLFGWPGLMRGLR